MNEENNLDGLKKLEETLHKKSALSSLRTYQGDMAKFIKDKNESVISVAIKEKERKEEREEKQENKPVKKTSSFQANLMIIISTFLLIVGGFTAFIFVWQIINRPQNNNVGSQKELITYNKLVTLPTLS